jgi:hypothetical protein
MLDSKRGGISGFGARTVAGAAESVGAGTLSGPTNADDSVGVCGAAPIDWRASLLAASSSVEMVTGFEGDAAAAFAGIAAGEDLTLTLGARFGNNSAIFAIADPGTNRELIGSCACGD